jgi:molecular chaperone GrpE
MIAGLDRNEIVRRFETLLDSALAAEAAPSGIDEGILSEVLEGSGENDQRRCDSYALWAAMTALTQEIKLQGRAFQELNLTLAAQTEKVSEELRALYSERERTQQRDAERRCRREILSALIDLRDRLGRGRESVREREVGIAMAARTGWWKRVLAKPTADPTVEAVQALVRGYELGIERLDQTLDEFNAREIRCQGESFDPRRMNAIESEESPTAAPNTVLEVYRSGYEWNGEVFRPAQVKVSRAPENPKQETE